MIDGPYPSHPEQARPGPEAAHHRTAGDRARDRLSDERAAGADTRALDPRDRELAQGAMAAEDPRAGSDLAHRITDPVFKAETLSELAINAGDPHIGSDIAHHIDPTIANASGDSIKDVTLARVARAASDPQVGRSIADGISNARIKAETVQEITGASA
jgi:hypothetical protein